MNYCTSDIHNDYDSFKKLLEIIRFDSSKDKLYILGDIVDRGSSPDPYGLINHIRRLERLGSVEILMGNHEKWLAQYIRQRLSGQTQRDYFYNTYDILRMLYSNDELIELADWMMGLPLQKEITVKEKKYLLAHAATSLIPKDEDYYLMGDDGFLLKEDTSFTHTSIVGHNPTPRLYWELGFSDKSAVIYHNKTGNIINVDTGCQTCSNGRLSGICLETLEEYYV